MAFQKRVYGAGEACDKCQTPTVLGKSGYYCKACYIAWKNQSGTTPSNQPQNSPQVPNIASQRELEELRIQIGELNVTIGKMRAAFADHEFRITKLEPTDNIPDDFFEKK